MHHHRLCWCHDKGPRGHKGAFLDEAQRRSKARSPAIPLGLLQLLRQILSLCSCYEGSLRGLVLFQLCLLQSSFEHFLPMSLLQMLLLGLADANMVDLEGHLPRILRNFHLHLNLHQAVLPDPLGLQGCKSGFVVLLPGLLDVKRECCKLPNVLGYGSLKEAQAVPQERSQPLVHVVVTNAVLDGFVDALLIDLRSGTGSPDVQCVNFFFQILERCHVVWPHESWDGPLAGLFQLKGAP
mmetsp:Transcript_54526/g.137645  ORF Transcript_54526/g.137645 Transcript_54526/m.137645 type:complete len:239 (-) Transcript_54526:1384-2100(-)